MAVRVRRLLVRRPWIYWTVVAIAALAAASAAIDHSTGVDAARDSWGDTRVVWVAAIDLAPGDPIDATQRSVPVAVVASGAVGEADELGAAVARQHVTAGEVIHAVDIAANSGPQALTPPGRLAVPVVESPASGAAVGDRVQVVADGIVLAADAIVVGHHDSATVVAVDADVAPLVPAAADAGRVTLLLVP